MSGMLHQITLSLHSTLYSLSFSLTFSIKDNNKPKNFINITSRVIIVIIIRYVLRKLSLDRVQSFGQTLDYSLCSIVTLSIYAGLLMRTK